MGAVLWQTVWGYILPVWPCPGLSSNGATVSPDPSCLSLQYLCCSTLCVEGLGSVCYIWSTCPVLSGVLCEFKYALSNSLYLSFFLSLGGPAPKDRASGLPGMMPPCCPQSTWPCCCSSSNCSACGYGTLTCSLWLQLFDHAGHLWTFEYLGHVLLSPPGTARRGLATPHSLVPL